MDPASPEPLTDFTGLSRLRKLTSPVSLSLHERSPVHQSDPCGRRWRVTRCTKGWTALSGQESQTENSGASEATRPLDFCHDVATRSQPLSVRHMISIRMRTFVATRAALRGRLAPALSSLRVVPAMARAPQVRVSGNPLDTKANRGEFCNPPQKAWPIPAPSRDEAGVRVHIAHDST